MNHAEQRKAFEKYARRIRLDKHDTAYMWREGSWGRLFRAGVRAAERANRRGK